LYLRGTLKNRREVYYWKNQQQKEVDFVIKKGSQVEQLVQVCYSLKNLEMINREIRALIKAGKELRCKNLLIITDDKEGKIMLTRNKIDARKEQGDSFLLNEIVPLLGRVLF